jgi:type I restriction enzyme S subunit
MKGDGKYSVYGGNGINGFYTDYLFEESKLILGRVGAKCGVVHITKPKSWVTDNALVIEFKEKVNVNFFYYCLTYHNLNKLSVSTAQPVISGAKIYSYEILLPPLDQQHQIVSEIERRFSVADKLEQTIEESLKKAETLKQSILKKAFEGKLV